MSPRIEHVKRLILFSFCVALHTRKTRRQGKKNLSNYTISIVFFSLNNSEIILLTINRARGAAARGQVTGRTSSSSSLSTLEVVATAASVLI